MLSSVLPKSIWVQAIMGWGGAMYSASVEKSVWPVSILFTWSTNELQAKRENNRLQASTLAQSARMVERCKQFNSSSLRQAYILKHLFQQSS